MAGNMDSGDGSTEGVNYKIILSNLSTKNTNDYTFTPKPSGDDDTRPFELGDLLRLAEQDAKPISSIKKIKPLRSEFPGTILRDPFYKNSYREIPLEVFPDDDRRINELPLITKLKNPSPEPVEIDKDIMDGFTWFLIEQRIKERSIRESAISKAAGATLKQLREVFPIFGLKGTKEDVAAVLAKMAELNK